MTVIGYTVITHMDDGSTRELKIHAMEAAAILAAAGGQQQRKNNPINADECPQHGPWTVQPGGIGKESQRPYNAFWKCGGRDANDDFCKNVPTKAWSETHPTQRNDASQQSDNESGARANTAADFDDLPF